MGIVVTYDVPVVTRIDALMAIGKVVPGGLRGNLINPYFSTQIPIPFAQKIVNRF